MTSLVLGPLLRHVSATTATVWVETERPCEVEVLGRRARTFTAHGHHYALVDVDGLEPGSATEYEVRLDGAPVWPAAGSAFPPSVIRTLGTDELRIAFGSCRRSPDAAGEQGLDALSAYAGRLAADPAADHWPTLLLMIGDQVYADELGPEMREYVRARRTGGDDPQNEIVDYEEYTKLYELAWGYDPAVRWLLSTVPTLTIFDDHDVRDDWNTSYAWRRQMEDVPWWRRRIVGGLGSYWVYQHLGNLSPDERATDPLYSAIVAATETGGDGGDGVTDVGGLLDEFADRADRDPAGTRWSYACDLGDSRLVMVDSRCSRLLTADRRAMLDDDELRWLDAQLRGGCEHLLIGSSLPYLLPRSIHHGEAWNEAVAAGAWGAKAAGLAEKVRQGADLEHWAAFQESFRQVAEDVVAVAAGRRGAAPASISFLSGDIHHSYLARVATPPGTTPITQVVCSPLRNPLHRRFRWANVLAARRPISVLTRLLAKAAGVARPPLDWKITDGPWFDNAIATVHLAGRTSRVHWETPDGSGGLVELGAATLD